MDDLELGLESASDTRERPAFVEHLLAITPPVCLACGCPLERKARPWQHYQAPFVPMDQWCPRHGFPEEHGFPDEQLKPE